MAREAIVAAVAAIVVGVLSVDPRRYWFWSRHTTPRLFWGVAVAQGVAYGLTGVAAVVLASVLSVDPWKERWFLDGLTFAVFGHALMRLQVDVFEIDRVRAPTTPLKLLIDWGAGVLDVNAREDLRNEIHSWDDAKLIEEAFSLYWEQVYVRTDIDVLVREHLLSSLKAASQVLEQRFSGVAVAADSRGRIRSFVFEYKKQVS